MACLVSRHNFHAPLLYYFPLILGSAVPSQTAKRVFHPDLSQGQSVVNLLRFFRYCLRMLHSGGSGCYKRGSCRFGLQWPSNHRNPPPAMPGSKMSVYPIARTFFVFCTPKGVKMLTMLPGWWGPQNYGFWVFPPQKCDLRHFKVRHV